MSDINLWTNSAAARLQKWDTDWWGDGLVAARLTSGDQDLILATAQGKAIRFNEADVQP